MPRQVHSPRSSQRPQCGLALALRAGRFLVALILLLFCGPSLFAVEVDLPVGDPNFSISIRGGAATSWKQGAYEVYVLRNGCEVRQGDVNARGGEGVLWIDRAESYSGRPSRVIVYLEGDVLVDFGRNGDPHSITRKKSQTLVDRSWLGRFNTTAGIDLSLPITPVEPAAAPAIVARGREARAAELAETNRVNTVVAKEVEVQQAQFTTQEVAPPAAAAAPAGNRRVQILRRSNTPFQFKTFNHPVRDEQVTIFSNGIQVVVDGLDQLGTVTMETDRLVIWSPRVNLGQPGGGGMDLQGGQYEFYLEGNIVFRQGDRVIYADRMYYNVAREAGVVLSAEMLTPVPDFGGMVRLKAEVLQQIDRQHFQAYGAALTTSRLGVPRYWLQSETVAFEDQQRTTVDPFTGLPVANNVNGQPSAEHRMLATSRNNFIYFFGTPVFYWPTIATDLTNPAFFIENIRFKQDDVFGFQVQVDSDLYQLLGVQNPPDGTKLTLSTDYLSKRGPAGGLNFRYDRDTIFGIPGHGFGFVDAWGIYDTGLDTLGADRINITHPTDFRGRVFGNHRQYLSDDWRFSAELGYLSDRNFQDQFFESEWDTQKDLTTGIELKRMIENTSFSLSADVRLNPFFTQTEQLPRLDHFWIGESILFDWVTWNEHSHVGYSRLRVADPPTDPQDAATFELLPWEVQQEGVTAATRQSLEVPLQLGPMKLTPYVLGEAAFWGNDINGDELTRLYGQAGVRASVPLWAVNPEVNSELFNMRGLAHKVVFDAEYFMADANQNFTDLPLYEQLDDDSQEAFRRRLKFLTFGLPAGTPVPTRFDERFYALRSGMQDWVTAPSTEIADDLQVARFGVRNRWQTKRGLPGQERIIDLVTLDVQASFFPNSQRDNFGEQFGLLDYDFRWHVGDRFSILSDGFADFFNDGLRQATIGGVLSRPGVGTAYLGYRNTTGPFESSLILGNVSYRMSEKWLLTAAAAFDLGPTGNIGQSFTVTRIGEAFLVRLGFNVDNSRNNVGVQFNIEPRLMPKGRLGVGGVTVLPAGAEGIE